MRVLGRRRSLVREPEPFSYTIVYRDFQFSLIVLFMAIAVLATIVPKTKANSNSQDALHITMRWDKKSNSDVDLWVKSPNDYPVGYSHLTGKYCELHRDDLGRNLDLVSRNRERTYCRSAPAGEYIVNAMLYRSYDLVFPVKVTVTVRIKRHGFYKRILRRTVNLTYAGQQKTLFRFSLTAKGLLVRGSINYLQANLYAKAMAR